MGRRSRGRSGWPGSRAVIGTVRTWWRDWASWYMDAVDSGAADAVVTSRDAVGITQRVSVSTGPSFREARLVQVGGPLALQAGRRERRTLLRAGVPSAIIDDRLGAPEPSALGLLGVDPLPRLERETLVEWAQEGVDYITAVPRELIADLPERVADAVARGDSWRTLRDDLRGRLGIGERHLELIARDQAAKLNGRITQRMQEAAGVEEYTWRATHDSRTRASHRAVDGQRFRWDGPGAPGVGFYGTSAHPGQAGQCRCTAEPVVQADWMIEPG